MYNGEEGACQTVWNIFTAAYSYTAALIGAGMASGQEILSFFNAYGRYGFIGVILSCAVFALFSYVLMRFCLSRGIGSFDEFTETISGGAFSRICKLCAGVFAFAGCAVMLSAAGETARMIFGMPPAAVSAALAALCALTSARGSETLLRANGVIGAVLAVGMAVCCLCLLRFRGVCTFSYSARASWSALVYSGYNVFSTIPVIVLLSTRVRDGREAACAALLGGVVLFTVMGLVFAALALYGGKVELGQIPMLTLAARRGRVFWAVYGAMLLAAILTTLFASAASLSETLRRHSRLLTPIALAAAYFTAGAGFSRLVNVLYRQCGCIGMVMSVVVIIKVIKNEILAKNGRIIKK